MGTPDDRERSPAEGTGPGQRPTKPRLPLRASIYIDLDGTVHFGSLFEELVPVADSLRAREVSPKKTGDESSANGAIDRAVGDGELAIDPAVRGSELAEDQAGRGSGG